MTFLPGTEVLMKLNITLKRTFKINGIGELQKYRAAEDEA